jgi:predicted oxidoreductase (fatty acid repression mutant protein)
LRCKSFSNNNGWLGHESAIRFFVYYNPLIDDQVKRNWQIPSEWKLIGQMPFGKPTAAPGEKEFMPLEERIKVFE